jgi:hypothetical protein
MPNDPLVWWLVFVGLVGAGFLTPPIIAFVEWLKRRRTGGDDG